MQQSSVDEVRLQQALAPATHPQHPQQSYHRMPCYARCRLQKTRLAGEAVPRFRDASDLQAGYHLRICRAGISCWQMQPMLFQPMPYKIHFCWFQLAPEILIIVNLEARR